MTIYLDHMPMELIGQICVNISSPSDFFAFIKVVGYLRIKNENFNYIFCWTLHLRINNLCPYLHYYIYILTKFV